MTEPGEKDDDESIPLLLARPSHPPPAPPPTPRPSKPPPELQAQPAVPPGGVRSVTRAVVRSRLGAIGLVVSALLLVVALFADVLASDHWRALVPYGPEVAAVEARPLAPPSTSHPFGTDALGRDVFARVVHGTRSYLLFASAAVVASLLIGGVLGALAGLFGGTTDAFLGRAIESISAFPPLVLVLGIQAAVPKPTLATLFLAIALTRWPEVARLVRAEVMLAATRDYVLAARALGASPRRVLLKHIAPNIRGPLIVGAALGISAVVLTEASLDFLRVGVPGGTAAWGETMSEFRDAPQAYWLLLFPGVFLFATVIAYNLVGEAFRSALAPRGR